MPLDPASLDSDTPRTVDGRTYPDHLRIYESCDESFLPLAVQLGHFEPRTLLAYVPDRRQQLMARRWIESATWRGLLVRADKDMRSPIEYAVDLDRAERRLVDLAV